MRVKPSHVIPLSQSSPSTPDCSLDDGAGRHVSLHPPPIPLVYTANLMTRASAFLCERFCQIDLAILQKYYVLTLELYAYLNYNLFSNNGHFSQMKSLFTNKLLITALPGFFIHISLRIGRLRISTKLGFYTQIMIIRCILERDKHEHKRMNLHFKAQPFFVVV